MAKADTVADTATVLAVLHGLTSKFLARDIQIAISC